MIPTVATETPPQHVSTDVVPLESATSAKLDPDPPGYDLRAEIGKGGMGVVYRAFDRGMNRDVAVKVLQDRYAPDSNTAARFVEEAQITGRLQHPGIPAVYQVAKYPDGRPFLAMKLIQGDTLDALLKSNAPINRLAVFEAICQALGYAHAHNVIHRDLKPANIMVGAFGEVQVMDWGLAKVLTVSRETKSSENRGPTDVHAPGDSERNATQAGSVMGTPAYMPPEQAAGEIDRIDQRSDVFGLGAILCVLLTGQPPFTGQDSLSVHMKAVGGETREALARLDQCDAEPGVVALCKQCLRFHPEERPADANAIAQIVGDLRREAEDRARQAELDRAKAEVFAAEQRKRRRVWLGLAAALLIGVFASSGLAVWANHARTQADQARQKETTARETAEQAQREEAKAKLDAINERNAKEKERSNAENQAALANGVKNYLLEDLLAFGKPARQLEEQGKGPIKMDPNLKVRDLVVRAAGKVEGKFAGQPDVEREIRWTLADTLMAMGRADLAVTQFTRALDLCKQLLGRDHPITLGCMNGLATCYTAAGEPAKALQLHEEVLAILSQKYGPGHRLAVVSMSNIASNYFEMGQHVKAVQLFEETLALQKRELGPDDTDVLVSMNNLAMIYSAQGKHDEAIKLHEETLALHKRKLGVYHPRTLHSMTNVAIAYDAAGRYDDALRLDEEALKLRKEKLGPDHPDTLVSMNNLASSYAALGKHEEALKLREETLAVRKQKFGPEHPDTLWSMYNLAKSYNEMSRVADALKLHEETLALRMQHLGPEHADTLGSMSDVAYTYTLSSRHPEALKLREKVLALRKRLQGTDHPRTFNAQWDVVSSLVHLKRYDEALAVTREVLTLAPKAEAAGKQPDRRLIPQMYAFLWQIGVAQRNPTVAREAAAGLEKSRRTDAAGLYENACYRSFTAGLWKDPREAKIEADKAVEWLKKAIVAGWRDRAHIDRNADWDAVRERADFKELVGSLPYMAPPPRAVR